MRHVHPSQRGLAIEESLVFLAHFDTEELLTQKFLGHLTPLYNINHGNPQTLLNGQLSIV